MRLILIVVLASLAVWIGCNPTQVAGQLPDSPDPTTNDNTNNADNSSNGSRVLPESVSLDVSELAVAAGHIVPAGDPLPDDPPPEENPPLEEGDNPPPDVENNGSFLSIANGEAVRTLSQLDEIMSRFSQINPLVIDPDVTQIEGTIVWDTRVDGAIPGPGETRVPNPGSGEGETRQLKIDFAAFDYDGDGTADGSGLPFVEPVAIRIWVTDAEGEFQPAACGLIQSLPTDDNAGAGELLTLSYARNGDGDIALIRWDQVDPNDKLLETWDEHPNGAPPGDNPPNPPEGEDDNPPPGDDNPPPGDEGDPPAEEEPPPDAGAEQPESPGVGSWGYSSFLVRHRVVDDLTEKTVKSSIDIQFIVARYLETAAAAVGHGADGANYDELVLDPPPLEYRMMTDFSIAIEADAGGVDTEDLDFLPLPDPAIFGWPEDFPVEPTF